MTAFRPQNSEVGIGEALLGDGRFLIALTGVALIASGGFALFLCFCGSFLPQDSFFLQMDAAQLAKAANPQVVRFMFHDRAAFGGSLLAIGTLYLWLAGFPLKAGQAWAWWTLALSGLTGFASFLAYLGYGYLDTWHGAATLALLPIFLLGMNRSRVHLHGERRIGCLKQIRPFAADSGPRKLGRMLLLAYSGGLILAGSTILTLGATRVFVDTDLKFIGMSKIEICGVSDRLVPLIAHDRAGFGGGLISVGLAVLGAILYSDLTLSCRQALWISGLSGFIAAIGVHFAIGYTNIWHLAPAFGGFVIFVTGCALVSARTIKQPSPISA